MTRAKKEKGNLANLVENVVVCFAYGLDIHAKTKTGETSTHLMPIPDEPIKPS
jgi:hypothetical protein